ncbi:MAG: PhoX family protein [Thioalkalivibrionaceae bacterium]
MSRRTLIKGTLATAVTGLFASQLAGCSDSDDSAASPVAPSADLLGFEAVPVSLGEDTIVVPKGYSFQILGAWGEPICGNFPAFTGSNTGTEQGCQIGQHHDGIHFFPIEGTDPYEGSSTDGIICVNHEYVEPRFLHRDLTIGKPGFGSNTVPAPDGSAFDPTDANAFRDPDHVLKEINAHGVTIYRAAKQSDGRWAIVPDFRNRKVTAGTVMEISGPARGSDYVKTKFSPEGTRTRGTLNNCAHGVTPWNTYLACEENWAGYFAKNDPTETIGSEFRRYGINTRTTSRYHWHRAKDASGQTPDEFARFDATSTGASATEDYRNEPLCQGYVVEIDPFDPNQIPVKRTHLGRFAHEGVVFQDPAEGEPIVCYAGCDARFEYIYKFVSSRPFFKATANGSLLDEGTLYAARFNEDGSGEWLELAPGKNGLSAANGFGSMADVCVKTREAADIAGATMMDRPEWGAIDRSTGTVYFALTNNTNRQETGANGVDAANPRANNAFGQIIRWDENGAPTATTFQWELFVLAGDTEDSADLNGDPLTEDAIFAAPDGLWVDNDRRVWIQTDIGESGQNRGVYAPVGNNGMLCANPNTGEIRRFVTGPLGQETTGCTTTPDNKTMFINFQHPGATTTADQWAMGQTQGQTPAGDFVPRSITVVITKDDGGVIGS